MGEYASDAGGRKYVGPKKPRKKPLGAASKEAQKPVARPPVKAPPKRVVSPDDRAVVRAPEHEPHNIQPLPKPVPVLQNYGYHGTMQDFASRLAQATHAHEQAFGYKPTPGLAFDLARAPGQVDFGELFRFPRSQKAAGAWDQIAEKPRSDKDLTDELIAAAKDGDYHKFLEENPAAHDLLKRRPGLAARALVAQYENKDQTSDPKVALGSVGNPMPLTAVVWKGGSQIADSLVHSPGGVYQLGKAMSTDVYHEYRHPLRRKQKLETVEILKGSAKQTKEDVLHPKDNPGYLFLDILGLASAGAGTTARAAAGARAIKAGEGGVARAFVRRPEGGRYKLTKGGASEEMPLSENAAVRAAQRLNLNRRQRGMTARHEADIPAGLSPIIGVDRAREFLQKHFSLETKMGREARARMRHEQTLTMGMKRELDAAAGRSINQARVFGRVPKKFRKGLTRGEQKAIQVLSTDDANPLLANRTFHEWAKDAGLGDPKAHQRQLADLKLAEKVLNDPNPRPQFVKALQLTRQVIAEQERIKVEQLGLDPVTAEKRVIASGEALRGEGLRTGERQNPESFYLPQVPKGKSKRPPYERLIAPRVGPGGIPTPRDLPELKHVYEGKAIQAGDIRIDATALAGESYARTVRAATIKNEYNRLWSAATDKPRSIFDRPIRDVTKIPDKLRTVLLRIDEGSFTAKDAAGLHPKDIDSINESLYPGRENKQTGAWELDEEIPGVKWVDSRLMAGIDKPPGPNMKIAEAINEPFRAITLYARPAYILNLLGNAGMALIHQGAFAIPNVGKALFSGHIYGVEAKGTLEALVGEGRAKSYVATGASASPGISQKAAGFWGRITDRDIRVSALLHELGRKGFSTDWENRAKLARELKDPARHADIIEAGRRANKAMVEFDNMTWLEQNYLRHFIFVYPWVSRSAVWSLRTMMEHPIKTGVLSHLGRTSEEDMDPYFKHAPAWFKRTGYFPVGWEGEKPKLINPTSVNSFSTMAELMTTAQGGVSDVPYASTEDLFGPFASWAVHGSTGRDEFGNEYPNGDWVGATQDLFKNLPIALAKKRSEKKDEKAPAFDVTKRGSLAQREKAALNKTVFSPGWLDGYGSLIAGGLTPRLYDPDAAAARYWASQPYKARHQHEMALIRQALDLQGELLGKKVPKEVKDAVDFADRREFRYKVWQDENGRDPTKHEKTLLDIELLAKENRISEREQKDLRAKLKQLELPAEFDAFRGRLFEHYGGADAMHQWDEDVRWVASFKPEIVGRDMDFLRRNGLGSAPVNEKDLIELGRKTLEFRKAAKAKGKEIDRNTLDADEKRQLGYELRVWEADQDKPISVNGRKYPSPVRFAWARMTPKARQSAIDAAVTKSWHLMTPFEKELLGKKVDPKTAKGWQAYDEYLTSGKIALQGQTPAPGYGPLLAKWIEKYGDNGKPVPGFYKDYLEDKKPLFRRMQETKQLQKTPNADTWRTIFVFAASENTYLNDPNYSKEEVRRVWKAYVKDTLYPWAVSGDPKFEAELDRYGGLGLLQRLLN